MKAWAFIHSLLTMREASCLVGLVLCYFLGRGTFSPQMRTVPGIPGLVGPLCAENP